MLLIAADTPFWQGETDEAARAQSLIRGLAANTPDLCLYHGDTLTPPERAALEAAFPSMAVHDLPEAIRIRRMRRNRFRAIARRLGANTPPGPLLREQREDFMRLCERVAPWAIFSLSPRLSDLIQRLPAPCPRTWVDCAGARVLRVARNAAEVADAAQERQWLDRFDGLVAATESDAAALAGMFPGKGIVTVEDDPAVLVEALKRK